MGLRGGVVARGVAGACPGARRRVPVGAAVFAPFETADAYNPNVIGGRVVNGDVAWPAVGPLDSALAVASPGADVFLTDRGICLKEAATSRPI